MVRTVLFVDDDQILQRAVEKGGAAAAAATEKLNRIGEQSAFGPLKAAHIMDSRGKNSILVPGEPPAVITGGAGLTVDKILKLLQEKQ